LEDAGMVYRCSSSKWYLKEVFSSILLVLFIVTPIRLSADTIALTKNGPLTAREGDIIEYQLKVVNESNADINNVQILDILPAEIDFVEAISTLSGVYEPSTGIWEIPILGTTDANKTAILQLRVLVKAAILSGPMDVISATNHIALVSPIPTEPNEVEHSTNIVCASCIDWEIVSTKLKMEWREETAYVLELRYVLYVTVANNGPVASQGSLTSTYFNVSHEPSLKLQPSLPVMVSLDEGKTQTFVYATSWTEDWPDSDYTVSWEFAINDDAFLDPVEPNTVSGSWTGKVEDGGGCFIATAAYGSRLDPHVQTLREFRDKTLMRSWIGRKFVSIYYEFSPPVARYIEQSEFLKNITRIALIPVIFTIETPFLASSLFGGMLFFGLKFRRYRKSTCKQ
jgi:uncharacterized repeat protein (TIGR01451 family)